MSELYHHGVKGMKWGVRKAKDTTSKVSEPKKLRKKSEGSAGNNIAVLARKLADGDFDSARKYIESEKKWAKILKKHETNRDWEAYDKAVNAEWKEERRLDRAVEKEYTKLQRSVFLSAEIKPSLLKARELYKSIDGLREKIMGSSSEAYQKAFEKYRKQNPNMYDVEYGFDHYHWPYSKERELAFEKFKSEKTSLEKSYKGLITDIGKKVTEGFGNEKINDYRFKNYAEWGASEAWDIIENDRYVFWKGVT